MSSAQSIETRSDLESLARVWALSGPLRGKVAAGIAYKFLQSACLGIAFGAVIWSVSRLAEGEALTSSEIWQVAGVMVLSLVGQCLFGFLSVSSSWVASYETAGRLRLTILDHLANLPMRFHLSRHQGDTVTALTADMETLANFMSDALPRIAQAFGLPVIVLVYLFWQDWRVGLVALGSVAVALPVFLWSSRRLARLGIRRQDMQAHAGARMIEYAQGIAVIRAFNRLAKGEESYRSALKDFRDISVKMVIDLTAPLVLFGMVLMLGVPVVLAISGSRHIGGESDIGNLVSCLVIVFALYAPLLSLIGVMELTRIADASLTRIDRIITARPLPAPALPRTPDGFEVAFKNVSFSYEPGKPVLRDVSFSVPERSITAIVGASGSGKSTLLNLVARFWDVDDGMIQIGGSDIREIAPEDLNSHVTMVFQSVYLFAGTIRDNIALGRTGASNEQIERAARAAQAHDFITRLPDGYDTEIGEGGSTLSGGERQRLSIARAILKDAPIVLLDEATAAIDPTNERAIQQAFSELVRNKTLIVVAHKLSTVRNADQILVLGDGGILERGHHESLVDAGGLYASLWERWTSAADWRIGA
ncbi:MAG: ABC transporter ATP-binding protein [Pseudomonadota bacterium]